MHKFLTLAVIFCALILSSCTKKKQTDTIVTTVEMPKLSKVTKAMADETTKEQIDWGGTMYELRTERQAQKDSCFVKDYDGNKYYNNSIHVVVSGPNGDVLNRVFTKADFAHASLKKYIKPINTTLLSIRQIGVLANGAMQFCATVGSPEPMDDDYVRLVFDLRKDGSTSSVSLANAEADMD